MKTNRTSRFSGTERSYVEVTVEKTNTPGHGIKGKTLWAHVKLAHDKDGYSFTVTSQGWGGSPMFHDAACKTFADRDEAIACLRRAVAAYESEGYNQSEVHTCHAGVAA